jgi:type IV secretory pathway TrbD component
MEAEVMWVGGEIYGCRFTHELPRAAVSAARLSGRVTRPNSGDVLETTFAAPSGGIPQTSMALAGKLSHGARVWIISGLALSLWIMIGATAYWVVA